MSDVELAVLSFYHSYGIFDKVKQRFDARELHRLASARELTNDEMDGLQTVFDIIGDDDFYNLS